MASGSQTCSGNCADLPHGAHEEQERDAGGRARAASAAGGLEHLVVVERAERRPQQHDAEAEAEVADAVDDERLLAGRRPPPARSYQKPISRYEQRPTASQKT